MKKLTAGIFTVLMGLVSVNAADAAVASKGYVDKEVATAKTNASELVGNLASGQVADNTKLIGNFESEITNNQEIKTAGVKSAGNLSQAVAALDAAVAAASGDLEGLGALASEDTVSTDLIDNSAVTSAKIADDAVTTDKIADNSVSSQQLTADVRTTISDLQKAVSESAADGILSKAKAYSDEMDGAQTTAITAAYQAADATTLESAKAYTDAEVKELAEGAVATNTAAITAINDGTTGILKQAKAYTDEQIEALDLQAISRVPAECGNAGNYCVLTTNGTKFVWEVIVREDTTLDRDDKGFYGEYSATEPAVTQ